ncbi:YceI family protein [Verrucomicrobium sp. BvORR106]|uniref:YceI family protein n=1 Tax=Verrucomicrobium sp. BvORR106 TaxID=1403819 RepID=UPI0005711663|nr:YceI family protein [Verrucomicrobium sp. BvORR106]
MKHFFFTPGLCLAVALLCFLTSPAPARADAPQRWAGTSTITFAGTSTLHDWSGTVAAAPFTTLVTLNASNQPESLKATVQVKATDMDTQEPKRDENMRKAMKVLEYPLITANLDAPFSRIIPAPGKEPATLPFKLSLVGKTHDVTGTISHWELNGDTATFDLDFDLSMKKCGISVPSVLLVIRVGDVVKVHAQVKLVRKQA